MSSKLENRDYVLVLDKSGSMSERDTKSGQSRWAEAQETTLSLARKLETLDPDGITVIPFASSFKRYENVNGDKVKDVFKENEPSGGTTLAPVLANVFADYLSRKAKGETKANGEILVVVTDGQPSDETAVSSEIVRFTKQLSNGDDEYGILFLQVGKDPQASKFLRRLDDDLVKLGAAHDIVDCKTMEDLDGMTLTEALVNALDD